MIYQMLMPIWAYLGVNIRSRRLQVASETPRNGLICCPRRPKKSRPTGAQDASRIVQKQPQRVIQEAAQRCLGSKSRPRAAQKLPKSVQEPPRPPKNCPRSVQECQRAIPDTPNRLGAPEVSFKTGQNGTNGRNIDC